jgi:hypothetical protein
MVHTNSAADRRRNLNLNFHFDADPDPDPTPSFTHLETKDFFTFFTAVPVYVVFSIEDSK